MLINIPIYGGKIILVKDRKQFHRLAHKYNRECERDDYCYGRCLELSRRGVTHYLVGVFNGEQRTLVHELAHATMWTLDRVGINPTDSNGETYCYLLAQLFAEATRAK